MLTDILLFCLLSSAASFFISRHIICRSLKRKLFQSIRSFKEGPDHRSKSSTPSFGGIGIFIPSSLSFLAWTLFYCSEFKKEMLILYSLPASFFILGFLDDLLKKRSKNGIPSYIKFATESALSIPVSCFILSHIPSLLETGLVYLPIVDIAINIGYLAQVVFFVFVIVGSLNAFNLADGLDGLMSLSGIAISFYMSFLCYTSTYVSSEIGLGLSVLCATLGFSTIGFLWFNCYPASIFIGDCGSLFFGSVLGLVACIIRKEFLFGIASMFFIIETASSFIQTVSRRIFLKRVFAYAPIHHHWESKGVHESKIAIRSFLFTICMIFICLFVE